MDLYNGLVNEVLMSEVSTKGWREFEQKYLPQAHRKDLFVQFTKYADNVDDKRFVGQAPAGSEPPGSPENKESIGYTLTKSEKTALRRSTPDMTLWTKPNHSDPTAIYTYPLEFVVNHPTSIPYGFGSPYLRVLKLRAGAKVLDLQEVTKESAFGILRRMGVMPADEKEAETMWNRGCIAAKMKFYPYGVTVPKVFFLLAQAGDYVPARWSDDEGAFRTVGNNEQRARFIKAGIQVVMDTAQTKAVAVIHSNEPEQCFFMDRSAFDIIDAFEVATMANPKRSYNTSVWSHERAQNKVLASVVQAIDPKDRIIGNRQVYGGIDSLAEPFATTGRVFVDAQWVAVTKRGRALSIQHQNVVPKDTGEDKPEHRQGSRHIPLAYIVGITDETGTNYETIDDSLPLADSVAKIRVAQRERKTLPEWRPVRGMNPAAEIWVKLLRAVPFQEKGQGSNSDFIDLDRITRAAPEVVHQLATLMHSVGWKWEKPTDPWDCVGCWIAAAKYYRNMKSCSPLGFEKGIRRANAIEDKMVKGDSGHNPLNKGEMAILLKSPVADKARSILAGLMDEDMIGDKQFLVSLIHGVNFLFHKRYAVMMDGAYPNFSKDIAEDLPELSVDCEKENYEKKLRSIWFRIHGDEPNSKDFDKNTHRKMVDQDFYEETGAHADPSWTKSVNEMISASRTSLDTVNSGSGNAAMPTVWRNPAKEQSFSKPTSKSISKDPRIAAAKRTIEKTIKRTLTWVRDPGTGCETAYIGHGRKVRVGLNDIKTGPMVVPIRADRLPADLNSLLGV